VGGRVTEVHLLALLLISNIMPIHALRRAVPENFVLIALAFMLPTGNAKPS